MRWINIKKDKLIGLECINPINDKHILRLSPNAKNMEKREREDSDARIVSIIVKNKPTLFDIKNHESTSSYNFILRTTVIIFLGVYF